MDFMALAQQCAPTVAPATMAAIVRHESSFKPLAINVNGGNRLERQPSTLPEAVATARWLIERGYSIDMGLGQVNSANLAKVGLTVDDVFDPCKNLAASAQILTGNYLAARRQTNDEQAALGAALSAYNTGNFSRGYQNGYVQAVLMKAGTGGTVATATASPIPLVGKASPKVARRNPTKRGVPMQPVATAEKSPEMVF